MLLAPVFVVIAICILVDDGGPVFFRQTRCGRDGDTFEMIKFRSMVKTAEQDLASLLDHDEGAGMLFKMRNDPRVTRVGRVLREHSLDELPQFWNILVGRHERRRSAAAARLRGRGVRGRCQAAAHDQAGDDGPLADQRPLRPQLEESVRLDLYYVENWSLTGDLMIVWRTAKTVINARGAY